MFYDISLQSDKCEQTLTKHLPRSLDLLTCRVVKVRWLAADVDRIRLQNNHTDEPLMALINISNYNL